MGKLAGLIALVSALLPWHAQAAGCSYTYNGTLPAHSTTTVNVPTLSCPSATYLRTSVYKPLHRTLTMELYKDGNLLVTSQYQDSDTWLAGYGDYPTTDFSGWSVHLINDGAKMRNVRITFEAR